MQATCRDYMGLQRSMKEAPSRASVSAYTYCCKQAWSVVPRHHKLTSMQHLVRSSGQTALPCSPPIHASTCDSRRVPFSGAGLPHEIPSVFLAYLDGHGFLIKADNYWGLYYTTGGAPTSTARGPLISIWTVARIISESSPGYCVLACKQLDMNSAG